MLQIRVIMLRTDLLPYDDVADLFIIDPDGFIIRKWNSKQLNNGLMTAEFQVRSARYKERRKGGLYRSQIILKSDFGPSEPRRRVRFRIKRLTNSVRSI